MRTWRLTPCFLFVFSLAMFAQQSSTNQNNANNNSSANGGKVTVDGCVMSVNGYFALETSSGNYRLKGDHDSLLGRNGQEVRIKGTITSAGKGGPKTLTISEMKKLADSCY